jgi:hypothetical protein
MAKLRVMVKLLNYRRKFVAGRQAGSSCMNSLSKADKNWNLAS